ncbi:MAG: LAGLIDADG family homing endonuclease, partial [Nanoarchaeota archaeon]
MTPEDRSAMHEALEQQCYHHDTIITLADGSERKIGELVEELLNKHKEKIIQGKDCLILPTDELEVLTTDFKNIFKTKINRISKHKAFDKFIKITFSNGRNIIVTPEHPIFTTEYAEIITKRADSIKIGENVPIPLIMPIAGEQQKFNTDIINKRAIQHINIPKSNCKEIFRLAGYFIAEGSREINRKKLIGINFTNKDQRLLDDFESLMKFIFKLSPYKQARIDEHEVRYMYRYTSRELAEFLIKNMPEMMKTSGEKQIPQVLMKGEKENISAMLSSMFEGDGHVSIKKRTIRVGYSTKSRRLAEQIQDLLLRFGIRSNLNNDREYFKVLITSYDNLQKFLEEISFITPEKNQIIKNYLNEKTIKRTVKDIIPKEFSEKIINIIQQENIQEVGKYKQYDIIYDHSIKKDKYSFSRQFIINLLKQVKKQENIEFLETLTSDIGFEKISGIEIIKNESENWVYDITIEPTHAFVSNGAILHNTVTISKANIQATLTAQTSV